MDARFCCLFSKPESHPKPSQGTSYASGGQNQAWTNANKNVQYHEQKSQGKQEQKSSQVAKRLNDALAFIIIRQWSSKEVDLTVTLQFLRWYKGIHQLTLKASDGSCAILSKKRTTAKKCNNCNNDPNSPGEKIKTC